MHIRSIFPAGRCVVSRGAWLTAIIWLVAFVSSPSADAGLFGKKKDNEQLVHGVDSAVVVDHTTIETPARGDGEQPSTEDAEDAEPLPTELPKTDYLIGPGDVLSFQSFDDPSLTRDSVVVLYDGTLSLPLIQDLNVEGLTREEAEESVKKAYENVFKEPQLSVSVRTAGSKYYYVLGDVMRASRFPYENPLSVLAAINMAGGLRTSSRGDSQEYSAAGSPGTLTKAFIIRTAHGKRQVIDLDLSYLTDKGPHPSQTLVLPGDFVYVPEGVNLVYVLGEVRNPNVFQLAEGQTLTQTLTRAGGPVETSAKVRDMVLMRQIDTTHSEVLVIDWRKILQSGEDILLVPGDVIYVPRKGLVRLGEFVSRVTGPLSQVMALYSQYFDTYYAEERNKVLVDTGPGNNATNILNNVRNFGELLQNFQSSQPAIPTP